MFAHGFVLPLCFSLRELLPQKLKDSFMWHLTVVNKALPAKRSNELTHWLGFYRWEITFILLTTADLTCTDTSAAMKVALLPFSAPGVKAHTQSSLAKEEAKLYFNAQKL